MISLTPAAKEERVALESLMQLYSYDWSELGPLDVGEHPGAKPTDRTAGAFDMAEFFVMRRYRRKGVGAAAATAAFDRFKGPWEIRQRRENVAATAFWRRVIGGYTGGKFDEVHWDNAAWTGPVQTFTTFSR